MSYAAAEWWVRHDPHLPRWLGRTGLWQAVLAMAGLAILVVNVIGYRHASADLAEYRATSQHYCPGDAPCMYWVRLNVDRVVIETSRRGPNLYELFVTWYDGETDEVDFPSDVPLLHRLSHGSPIWVGYPPHGYIVAIWDDTYPPADNLAATQTMDSPVYESWSAMSWLIAGAAIALFFAWRAVLVGTGRNGPTGQNRLRWMAGGLVGVAVIAAFANSDSPSTFDSGVLLAYIVTSGIVVFVTGLLALIGWIPLRDDTPVGRPLGRVTRRRKPQQTGAAISRRRRPAASENPPVDRSTTDGLGALPPAGGLGPLRLRWLISRAPVWPGGDPPLATVEAPPALAAVVARAAGHIHVATPDRVLIDCRPVVEVHIARDRGHRVDLYIGAPLALALPERDLRAVVAHALAVLHEPRPWLASALIAARRGVQESQDVRLLLGQAGVPAAAFLANTEAFADEIEQRADAAAVRTAPPTSGALTALVRAGALARHFTAFAEGFVPEEERPVFPAALYSGWASTLEYKTPAWLRDPARDREKIASDVAAHPGLSGGRGRHLLESASDGLWRHGMLASLSTVDELRLSQSYLSEDSELDPAEIVPAEWSSLDADEVHRDELPSPEPVASALLGHPASPAEILAMFDSDGGRELSAAVTREARRSVEALHNDALLELLSERLTSTPGEVLAGLVVDTLHERGYRRRDALRPQLMTGPDGEPVDVYAAVTSALESASGMRRLRVLLSADA